MTNCWWIMHVLCEFVLQDMVWRALDTIANIYCSKEKFSHEILFELWSTYTSLLEHGQYSIDECACAYFSHQFSSGLFAFQCQCTLHTFSMKCNVLLIWNNDMSKISSSLFSPLLSIQMALFRNVCQRNYHFWPRLCRHKYLMTPNENPTRINLETTVEEMGAATHKS